MKRKKDLASLQCIISDPLRPSLPNSFSVPAPKYSSSSRTDDLFPASQIPYSIPQKNKDVNINKKKRKKKILRYCMVPKPKTYFAEIMANE